MASQRPFAAFDIDGTLIRWQLYHALTDALAKRGHINIEAFEAIKDARMKWKRRSGGASFKGYELQLILVYEEVLKTLSAKEMHQAVEGVFEEYKDQVYTYTRDLLSSLKKQGYCLLAISGSQSEIVAKIAKYYGFEDYIGTTYEYKADKFTGNKVIGSLNKGSTLKKMVNKHNLSYKNSFAIGDSASDVELLELVENPIAFNPETELFKEAQKHSWKIVLERKNMVYELEEANGKYQLVKTNA